ncbi:hypothetical protein PY093_02860 [Cytobacillus sp. S13-E01]|uniref:hypothetical protein n=1 Tax=Cytobacillus sp. S13-E01 TaxID=3031326 RepID=UPI0023D8C742|nr:hypothetical protein [Cytobacillus sp. S13-E01]MDF0725654.1 hypothetical protein [Cytobacillus sp. S13-E01]
MKPINHQRDYDRNHDREDTLSERSLKDVLESSYEIENELMRSYLITAEKIHDDEELKLRLRNFAEGNAKRTRQLLEEIGKMQ